MSEPLAAIHMCPRCWTAYDRDGMKPCACVVNGPPVTFTLYAGPPPDTTEWTPATDQAWVRFIPAPDHGAN